MSRIVCPRCGRDDQWSDRCWMCDTSLKGVAPVEEPPKAARPAMGRFELIATAIGVTILATAALVVLVPVLLLVTCFGVVALGGGHMGR
jgi:hypothetical protein